MTPTNEIAQTKYEEANTRCTQAQVQTEQSKTKESKGKERKTAHRDSWRDQDKTTVKSEHISDGEAHTHTRKLMDNRHADITSCLHMMLNFFSALAYLPSFARHILLYVYERV